MGNYLWKLQMNFHSTHDPETWLLYIGYVKVFTIEYVVKTDVDVILWLCPVDAHVKVRECSILLFSLCYGIEKLSIPALEREIPLCCEMAYNTMVERSDELVTKELKL